jgi:hypothetical protein
MSSRAYTWLGDWPRAAAAMTPCEERGEERSKGCTSFSSPAPRGKYPEGGMGVFLTASALVAANTPSAPLGPWSYTIKPPLRGARTKPTKGHGHASVQAVPVGERGSIVKLSVLGRKECAALENPDHPKQTAPAPCRCAPVQAGSAFARFYLAPYT